MTKDAKQPEPTTYVANVPVIIRIGHGETILDEYDEVIDLEMTEDTPDGKYNIAMEYYLTKEKGLSTEEALFTLASETVKKEAVHVISFYTSSPHDELHLHIKRNGEIFYEKQD
jgi:hypothetical protein